MAIELTERAARQISIQLGKRGSGAGLRVGVRKAGCAGFSYTLDFADQPGPGDLVFVEHGISVVVDRQILPYLDGMRLDYRREGLNEVFKFDNPNVKDSCGCGQSFKV